MAEYFRKAEFGVVLLASCATLTPLTIVLSSRSVCQPAPVRTHLSCRVVIKAKPGHHASASYSAVLRTQAWTALIIDPGATPCCTLLIQRINCVARCVFPHHSCTCYLSFSSKSSHTLSHLIYGDGETLWPFTWTVRPEVSNFFPRPTTYY